MAGMLDWDPALAIDVPEIDAQHRALFAQAARFDAAVRAGESSREIQQLLDFLSRYAVEHFEAEERLMREVEYPRLPRHALEHAEFRRRLSTLLPHWESEGDSVSLLMALSGFLMRWLREHVATSDRAIGEHIRARARRPPP
jgi:hemerythrin-like metal-binding protein